MGDMQERKSWACGAPLWGELLVLMLLTSCGWGGGGKGEAEAPADTVASPATPADTMEVLIRETPMPESADELFDDFLFNFAANDELQLRRVRFPVMVWRGEHADTIWEEDWRHDRFFLRQGYYTLIFDDESQMDAMKDTAVTHVMMERIYYRTNSIEQIGFHKRQGLWHLDSLRFIPISASPDGSFIEFYNRFATDTLFQTASISATVDFSSPDPDDDFSVIEGLLTPDTWPAFAPRLPSGTIYNIIYGDRPRGGSSKLFVIRGISNSLETQLYFSQDEQGRWMLTRLKE